MKDQAIKLDDEQMRRFICDGVLVLHSGVPPEVHQHIFDKIQWNQTHEFNMGNNTLPRIAELQQVLDAPVQLAPCSEVASQGRPRQPETLRLLAERGGFLVPGLRHGSSSSRCAPFFVKQEMWRATPDARQPA